MKIRILDTKNNVTASEQEAFTAIAAEFIVTAYCYRKAVSLPEVWMIDTILFTYDLMLVLTHPSKFQSSL